MLVPTPVAGATDIERGIEAFSRAPNGGLLLPTDGTTIVHRDLVIALAAHGLMDLVHGSVIANPGVPAWWPSFCLTYDVTAAAYLASLLLTGRVRATA